VGHVPVTGITEHGEFPKGRPLKQSDLVPPFDMGEMNMRDLRPKWTRFCFYVSRKIGGRSVFGKRDLS
jgi:hypothetical protein